MSEDLAKKEEERLMRSMKRAGTAQPKPAFSMRQKQTEDAKPSEPVPAPKKGSWREKQAEMEINAAEADSRRQRDLDEQRRIDAAAREERERQLSEQDKHWKVSELPRIDSWLRHSASGLPSTPPLPDPARVSHSHSHSSLGSSPLNSSSSPLGQSSSISSLDIINSQGSSSATASPPKKTTEEDDALLSQILQTAIRLERSASRDISQRSPSFNGPPALASSSAPVTSTPASTSHVTRSSTSDASIPTRAGSMNSLSSASAPAAASPGDPLPQDISEVIHLLAATCQSLNTTLKVYDTTKSHIFVEQLNSFRDLATHLAQLLDSKNATEDSAQLLNLSMVFLQSAMNLIDLAAKTHIGAQRDGSSAPFETTRTRVREAMFALLEGIMQLSDRSSGIINAYNDSIQSYARVQEISMAIREAGMLADTIVKIISVSPQTFDVNSFGTEVANLGRLVKEHVIFALSDSDKKATVVTHLTDCLTRAKSFSVERSITARTLFTTSITSLLDCLITLI